MGCICTEDEECSTLLLGPDFSLILEAGQWQNMCAGAKVPSTPITPYGQKAGSVRSKQSIGWAKKAATAPSSATGYDDAIPVSKTRRIFVYVIGGITHR